MARTQLRQALVVAAVTAVTAILAAQSVPPLPAPFATPWFRKPTEVVAMPEGHTLTVQGRPEHGHEAAAFTFTFALPPDTSLERLHAEFLDGVLKVAAPLLHRDGKRTVEIDQPHLVRPEASGG